MLIYQDDALKKKLVGASFSKGTRLLAEPLLRSFLSIFVRIADHLFIALSTFLSLTPFCLSFQ